MRGVPLARRTFRAGWRRAAAGAVGVGLALMLVLLLDGLWAGVRVQATVYEDRSGADLFVVAPGTENLFADTGSLPAAALARVRRTPGVTWADPVRARYAILDLHGRKVAVMLVGAEPGGHGGPWAVRTGRAPRAGEIAIDAVLARRHGLRAGDRIEVMGRDFRVTGTTSGTAGFMTGFVFLTHDDASALLGDPGRTDVVLAGTAAPAGVRARLERAGLTVRSAEELRSADLRLATRVFGTPLRLMAGIAFAAGTLVIAITAYAAVAEQRRDYGILKAIGAGTPRLVALALAQTLGLAAAGFAAGLAFSAAGRAALVALRPQFAVVVSPASIARAAAVALLMAAAAAVVPARRLARLDPAAAFRGA